MAKRQLTSEDRDALRVAEEIDKMVGTSGWKIYSRVLANILTGKRNELEAVASPSLDGMAQVLVGENLKGSIIGIKLALELTVGMLNTAEIIRRECGLSSSAEGTDE